MRNNILRAVDRIIYWLLWVGAVAFLLIILPLLVVDLCLAIDVAAWYLFGSPAPLIALRWPEFIASTVCSWLYVWWVLAHKRQCFDKIIRWLACFDS